MPVELISAEEGRSNSVAPFRRALAWSVGVLIALCAVFVVLASLQGPKLSSAQVDTGRVVEGVDQQLRLFANQAVAQVRPEQVSVSPAAPFTVTTQNDVIAVQFSERLDYGTEYTVAVGGVTSVYQDRAAVFEYSFMTNDASFHFLDRADPAGGGAILDAIIRVQPATGERETIYEGARIQDYVVFDGAAVVATINDDDTSSLTLVSLLDGTSDEIQLPDIGTIDQLAGAGETAMLGFTLTSKVADPVPRFSQTLFSIDLAGDQAVTPVLGLAGTPLEALGWLFLPGGSAAVVRTVDDSLLRVDLEDEAAVTPLGSFVDLHSASPDGGQLVVADIFGPLALSLDDGSELRLVPSPIGGVVPAIGDIHLLHGEEGEFARVQQAAILDEATGRFASYLVYDDGAQVRILYEAPDGRGSIEGFTVSPNGQYVAVSVIPDVAASVSDGYAVSAAATSVTTIVLDVASGAAIGSVDGFDVIW